MNKSVDDVESFELPNCKKEILIVWNNTDILMNESMYSVILPLIRNLSV